ncbi:MAG: response regulator [Kiritimatiellia bacterium]
MKIGFSLLVVFGCAIFQATAKELSGPAVSAVSLEERAALTPEETGWVDRHPVIRFGFNTDCPPFSFVSHRGESAGMVADYEFHISRFIGFPFALQTHSTAELEDMARMGRLDVLANVEESAPLQSGFIRTHPYVFSPMVVVMREGAPYVENLSSLKDKRFVEFNPYPSALMRLRRDYPWLQPESAQSVERGLELVRAGKADAFIGVMATVIPALNRIDGNLRVVLSTPYEIRLAFAVREDWPVLAGIINKALAAIPGEERDRIHNAWVVVPRDRFNWRALVSLVLAGLGLAGVVIVIIVIRNHMLSREIAVGLKHEADMRQARDAAYAASQAKSMFLANMSHEIRTPLNAILGFAQVLARDAALSPESREQVETIARSGEHLLGLINDILEISKIEADRVSVEPAPFDLFELLRDMEAMFRVRTRAKGVELKLGLDAGVPRRIVSDVGKLRQILINLIGNAVKFTRNGRVLIRVSVFAASDRGILWCEVEDTGPGISARDREKIFETFMQGEGLMGTGSGTGLGLSISRRYAKLLGGEIALVWTEPGKGSIFRCEIPYDLPPGAEAGPVEPNAVISRAVMAGQRPPRILVVDDESINRRVIVRALESLGFEISEASNGQEALTQYGAILPDLVLMDIRMPVMDGIEATKKIQEQFKDRACPVIALTASAFESDKERILAAGLTGYVRKPFKLVELLDVFRTHLPVQYEYAASGAGAEKRQDEYALSDAAKWPAELRAALCKAARGADVAELEELLAGQRQSPAVDALRRLLAAYDYPAIGAALSDPPAGSKTS